MSKNKWLDNSIQFPRLLAEICATCQIRKKDFESLCESMDLTKDEVNELFDRAQAEWEKIKARTIAKPGKQKTEAEADLLKAFSSEELYVMAEIAYTSMKGSISYHLLADQLDMGDEVLVPIRKKLAHFMDGNEEELEDINQEN